MPEPDDQFRDEIEHPDQTDKLRSLYSLSSVDRKSLLNIRTRMLEQRALQNEEFQAGQFTYPEQMPSSGGQSAPPSCLHGEKKLSHYRQLVVLVAVLCIVLLNGSVFFVNYRATELAGPHQTFIPDDIKMTSASVGWGYGPSGPDHSYCVERTTDGGKTWQVFDLDCQTGEPAQNYFFLDDQTAWVPSGTSSHAPLMHTTDGGQHWILPATRTLDFQPMLSFVDRQHGWAWAPSSILSSHADTLYSTSDGGVTWTGLGKGLLPAYDALKLFFTTPQLGWATLLRSDTRVTQLYMTQNGGATWQLQPFPTPKTGAILGIQQGSTTVRTLSMSTPAFFNAQDGLISIIVPAASKNTSTVYLYKTTDGGKNWSPLDSNIPVTSDPQHILVACLAENKLILTDQHTLYIYTLINNIWQRQAALQILGSFTSLNFLNNQRGWIKTSQPSRNKLLTTLYTTGDGGKHWNEVTHMDESPQNFREKG